MDDTTTTQTLEAPAKPERAKCIYFGAELCKLMAEHTDRTGETTSELVQRAVRKELGALAVLAVASNFVGEGEE